MNKKTLLGMNKTERSLLIYLETCLVDRTGHVDTRRMNKEDMDIAKKWNEEEFIAFGRLKFHYIEDLQSNPPIIHATHWVSFSDKAWELAAQERRARAGRMFPKEKVQYWIGYLPEKTGEDSIGGEKSSMQESDS